MQSRAYPLSKDEVWRRMLGAKQLRGAVLIPSSGGLLFCLVKRNWESPGDMQIALCRQVLLLCRKKAPR